jgi:hypothetical protein
MQYEAPNGDQQQQQQASTATASSSSAAPAVAPEGTSAPVHKLQGEEDLGPSEGPPPSYAEVVRGDNKVQSHE